MSEIKYVTPSGLAHYDEKIKEVINKVDTSTNTKVTQTPTSSNETYPLLLSPTGQTSEVNTTSYFNSDVVLNPSTKTISANIDGNAETATKAVQDGDGNTITTTYVKETPEFTESTERNNIESRESMSTILGKVKKYFTDLKSHAFNALANNLTTTTEGYALDATQGKALQDKIGSTDISAIGDGTATGAISSLNSNLSKRQYIYGTEVQFFNEGSYINALCIICEIGIDSSNTDVKYIEGTFTFINQQYENNTGASEYYKYTTDVHFDKHNQSISLFSSNTYELKPVIVKYTNPSDETDIHYYLSLLFTRGSIRWNRICFNGITNINMEGRYIKYSGSTLPDGYTIYQEPLPMRKLNLVSGYIGNDSASYSYDQIKALEDRITSLENK